MLVKRIWGPGPAVAEQDVGEDEEFSDDRDERHLGRFAGGEQSLVLGPHRRIEADRDQGRHVGRLAQRSTPAADAVLTAVLAGVTGDGGRLAAPLCSRAPSSGISTKHGERGGFADTGMLTRMSKRACKAGSAASSACSAAPIAAIWRSIGRRSGLGLSRASGVCVRGCGRRRGPYQGAAGAVHSFMYRGRAEDGPHRRLEQAAKRADRAVTASVLACRPIASAQRRAWRGLTLTSGRPAAAKQRSKAR